MTTTLPDFSLPAERPDEPPQTICKKCGLLTGIECIGHEPQPEYPEHPDRHMYEEPLTAHVPEDSTFLPNQ